MAETGSTSARSPEPARRFAGSHARRNRCSRRTPSAVVLFSAQCLRAQAALRGTHVLAVLANLAPMRTSASRVPVPVGPESTSELDRWSAGNCASCAFIVHCEKQQPQTADRRRLRELHRTGPFWCRSKKRVAAISLLRVQLTAPSSRCPGVQPCSLLSLGRMGPFRLSLLDTFWS